MLQNDEGHIVVSELTRRGSARSVECGSAMATHGRIVFSSYTNSNHTYY